MASAEEHPTGCAYVSLTIGGRAGPHLADDPSVTSDLIRVGAIPVCAAGQLRATASAPTFDPDGRYVAFTFTNRSRAVCRVAGFPRLRLLDAAGHRLPAKVHRGSGAGVVSLDPGEAASGSVTWTRCGAPRVARVRVALPGAHVAVRVGGRVTPQALCAVPRAHQRQPADAGVLSSWSLRGSPIRINRDYPTPDARTTASALIERIPAELSLWREVSEGDRVEAAALTVAAGTLRGSVRRSRSPCTTGEICW